MPDEYTIEVRRIGSVITACCIAGDETHFWEFGVDMLGPGLFCIVEAARAGSITFRAADELCCECRFSAYDCLNI